MLATEDLPVVGICLDITVASSRDHAADYVQNEYGRLDILVNNAGVWLESESASIGAQTDVTATPEDILRLTFETNFFGTVLLTQRLVPLLRAAPAGRIVNVSSIHGSIAMQTNPKSPIYRASPFAYSTSKTALNAFTVHLARELKDTQVKVNMVHPGWVKTRMGGNAAVLDESDGARCSIHYATLDANGPTGGFFQWGDAIPF